MDRPPLVGTLGCHGTLVEKGCQMIHGGPHSTYHLQCHHQPGLSPQAVVMGLAMWLEQDLMDPQYLFEASYYNTVIKKGKK